jgi:hypothetical protein
MRPYTMEEIWGPDSPLVVGSVADGAELSLSDWVSWTTNMALPVQPDLAPAYFLRAWSIHLRDTGNPAVLVDVERAAELASDDPLYARSLAYLKAAVPVAIPTKSGICWWMALGRPQRSSCCLQAGESKGWHLVASCDPCFGWTRTRLL